MRPTLNFSPELLLRAQPIKLVFFDVDGVLTDGGLYFTEHGETMKRFHTLDGHGIKLLQRAGITEADWQALQTVPLEKFKGRSIIVNCASGNRSSSACGRRARGSHRATGIRR